MSDYKDTLLLPQTEFPMKADLARREPEFLARWESENIFAQMNERRKGATPFLLHDGPPYANGDIHIGHVMNKVLKDIVVKYKAMSGYATPFTPGWDCHGLPIELQVEKTLGGKKKGLKPLEIRQKCREYADETVDRQRAQFKRLGVFADWDRPYRTMDFGYQARIVREFATCVEKGMVYRGKKPIYWCASCATALAEAEVEYADHTSPSITVKFHLNHDVAFAEKNQLPSLPVYLVIWTTTPWTLPANLGIALNPHFHYVALEVVKENQPHSGDEGGRSSDSATSTSLRRAPAKLGLDTALPGGGALPAPIKEIWIVAEGLVRPMTDAIGLKGATIVGHIDPRQLDRATARHPFIERDSLIVMGDHVTLEAGTGCVHTAPGHGQEDYVIGQHYGLEPFAPLDQYGRFTEDVGCDWLTGLSTTKANPVVIEKLKEKGSLVFESKMTHSYPHCWRCRNPVIFRATAQWFLSMDSNQPHSGVEGGAHTALPGGGALPAPIIGKDNFRSRVLHEVDKVRWIPTWGRERIYGMLQNRPDWCLSRQRSWGVPLVAVHCTKCNEVHTSPELVRSVADVFEKKGADAWYADDLKTMLPKGFVCPTCLTAEYFEKEWNILDVWFDSGVSYAAVIEKQGLKLPVDLYLEGSDQHRGWFHTSLLTSVATRNAAPYKAVLTHGFVMDAEGRKYSKSAKNYLPPEQVIAQNGAELLRLWVSAEDYRNDIRFSQEILSRVIEGYRKIRNTARFLMGNLFDFDPANDVVVKDKLFSIDQYASHLLHNLVVRCRAAYDNYEFHAVYHALNQFCTVDMSAFYLDVLKDRLYCEKKDGLNRRSAQTVIWTILVTMARLMAPILTFTAEEIWRFAPQHPGKAKSVFLTDMPSVKDLGPYVNLMVAERWDRLREFRSDVTAVMELARKDKLIGNSLDATITVSADGDLRKFLEIFGDTLPDLLLVSEVKMGVVHDKFVGPFSRNPQVQIGVSKSEREKCERCWRRAPGVGHHKVHPTLCTRCAGVV